MVTNNSDLEEGGINIVELSHEAFACFQQMKIDELIEQLTTKDQEITTLKGEVERLKKERDKAIGKSNEYFRLLRECKEVTYHHNPMLNIRICDALTDY